MDVAVIGGSGFIGTCLVGRLLAAGHAVRIVDKRPSRDFPALRADGDVRDSGSLLKSLRGCAAVYNLAAEHKDNVSPFGLYEEVNVGGARAVVQAAAALGIPRIIFTSSVAVYGFAPPDTDESGSLNPFNEYGRTKMLAEKVYREWRDADAGRTLITVRPTVVFGPRNRGNVYNLLRLMSSGSFVMVGNGRNVKSLAYVENVAAFLEFALSLPPGDHLYNYADKPDMDTNALVALVQRTLGRPERIRLRLPYAAGYAGGLALDVLSAISRREFPISAVRVRKFCATTRFASSRIAATGFKAPHGLAEALERTIDHEFLDTRRGSDSAADLFDSE